MSRSTVADNRRNDYKFFTPINLRYGDTDRQGHINNAVYCTLYESGRVDFLFDGADAVAGTDTSYVIAKIALDYLAEMHFPGVAEIGSKVLSLGRTSFRVGQAIFIGDKCFSSAESIIVLLDSQGKPTPLNEVLRRRLESLMFNAELS